jgi:hypothetical protein
MAMTSAERKKRYRKKGGAKLRAHEKKIRRAWLRKNREHINALARERRKDPEYRKKEYERQRKWKLTTGREKFKESTHRRYLRLLALKPLAMKKLGGVLCRNCGCDDIRFLEINHIKGGGGKQRKAGKHPHGARLYYKIVAGKIDTKHLNVLCRICNALDHVLRLYPEIKGKVEVKWSCSKKAVKT